MYCWKTKIKNMKNFLKSTAFLFWMILNACGGPESPGQTETESKTVPTSLGQPTGNADQSGNASQGGVDSTSLNNGKNKESERSY